MIKVLKNNQLKPIQEELMVGINVNSCQYV
jgi:hypothetical protein